MVFRYDGAEPFLTWRPDRGTHIAVVARDGSGVRWFGVEPFWVWHIVNAFEDLGNGGATTITVDFPYRAHPGIGIPGGWPDGA